MKMPVDVPANPDEIYRDEWEGWENFLSYQGAPPLKANAKRSQFYKPVPKTLRCGACHTCLNPRFKKACLTIRAQQAGFA